MKNNTQGNSGGLRWIPLIIGVVIALIGLCLLGGGAYLAWLGGSWYYLVAGVALLISGVMIASCNPSGAWLFAVTLVLSVVWAIWDAGMEFWPLVSRLFMLSVIGFVVALIYPILTRVAGTGYGRGGFALAALIAVGLLITAAFFFKNTPLLTAATAPEIRQLAAGQEPSEWRQWGGTTAGDRFAAFDQINKENIGQLEVAWTFRTGDLPVSTGSGAEDQNTPQQIGDTLYHCTAYGKVFALDVDTGAERWRFDPQGTAPNWQRCRGLGYHEEGAPGSRFESPTLGEPVEAMAAMPADGDVAAAAPSESVEGALPSESAEALPEESGPLTEEPAISTSAPPAPVCQKRLFLPTIDARLIALNAETGEPCADFGVNGTVDLSVDMGEILDGYYQQTSTPLVAGNLVVVGGRVADNFSIDEPPGVVRAFDVHSGELVWAWDSGNPDITKRPPPGQTYTRSSPNVWAAMAYDPERELIYLPTGNATPDFYAGQRTEMDDKFSSSVVAVEARTGRVRWSFQMTHHDLWDFDIPAQPLLYDIPNGQGGTLPGLAQVTKQGEIFLLNRETGEPIAEVEERPVPQGNVPGERYAPTQPFSVGMPSIGNQRLVESDMWGATLLDQLLCRIQFVDMRHEGVYTPPGLDRSLQFPGSLGGMNWGGVSVDRTTDYMFVNDMRLGLANYMIPREYIPSGASGIEMGVVPQAGTPFGAMRERFLSQLGIPCQKPPFGTMSAIDLKTRQLVWQVPVGTVKDTGPLGIKMHLPIPIGMPTLGASMATQSGLLFFAGTQDYYLRAFDSATGEEIWKARLPVGSQSGPMAYVSPNSGKQYVVITAGGARQSPDRGDYVIAYALPE